MVLYVVTAFSVTNKVPKDRATGAVAKAPVQLQGNVIVSAIHKPCRGSHPARDALVPDETNLKE